MASLEIRTLKLEALKPSKHNPRKTFDADRLADLKKSIAKAGIITPLIVRPNGSDGRFEILAGERRFRMAAELELAEVPVRVVENLSDADALELMIVENLQREDVHPLEEAEGFEALLKADPEQDVEALATKCGKSASYVYQRLKLCELSKPAKKSFMEGELTAGHAIEIARLTEPDQKRALEACKTRTWDGERNVVGLAPVIALRQFIKREIHLDLHSAPFPKDEAALLPEAGPCTTCPKRTGFNPVFADVAKKDICTDGACFTRKSKAFLSAVREQLLADKTKFVEIVRHYRGAVRLPAGVLEASDYEKVTAKNRCASTIVGLMVGETVERGLLIDVCADRKCKKHLAKFGVRSSAGENDSYKRQQKLKEKKAAAEGRARRATLAAIAANIGRTGADPEDFRMWARSLLREMHQDTKRLVLEQLGIEPVRTKHQYGTSIDYEKPLAKAAAEMAPNDLAALLTTCSLAACTMVGIYGSASATELDAAAKRHKVKPVRAERVTLAKPKKTPAPKVARKKKVGKVGRGKRKILTPDQARKLEGMAPVGAVA